MKISVTLFSGLLSAAFGIDWIGMHGKMVEDDLCDGLSDTLQYRLCSKFSKDRKTKGFMEAIHTATIQTTTACSSAMAKNRWNCESLKSAPKFKRDLRKGTSERAFVHALSSAAVSINIANRCARGDMGMCGCRYRPQDEYLDPTVSKPCEHDLKWANEFSKQWTDAPILRSDAKNRYQRMFTADNNAGREVALQSMRTVCKCHGVSGSCTEKTCWKVSPTVEEVAESLKNLYESSVRLPKRRRNDESNRVERSSVVQMYYVDKSNDFCEADRRTGSAGTAGRTCDPNSFGEGSCDKLCCGRGHKKVIETTINENYNCRYVWCCRVECDTVEETTVTHICK